MMARFPPETARYLMGLKPSDDGPLLRDAGVNWRPYSDTLADLLDWMTSRPTCKPGDLNLSLPPRHANIAALATVDCLSSVH
jgi:hypothetical protein